MLPTDLRDCGHEEFALKLVEPVEHRAVAVQTAAALRGAILQLPLPQRRALPETLSATDGKKNWSLEPHALRFQEH